MGSNSISIESQTGADRLLTLAESLAGFGYSESLKDSGVTWDEPTLDKWIANPGAVIPGNQMTPPYGGVADAAIRKKIVAYLKTISPADGGKSQ